VVLGPSGVGKTALLGKVVAEVPTPWLVLERYLGVTPSSSDVRGLLNSLGRELGRQLGLRFVPSDDRGVLQQAFAELLRQAGAQRRVVLVLDALDQLEPGDNAHALDWLPWELPAGVKLIVSALEAEGPVGEAARSAREKVPAEQCLSVSALEPKEAYRLLFGEWLKREAKRRLRAEQRRAVKARLRACRLPLYLRVVFEEVRRWQSFDGLPLDLAADTPGVLAQLFDRLEERRHHGLVLVRHALGYLAAGRHGLSEPELLDVLSADEEVMRDFHDSSPTERAKPAGERLRRLPLIFWSRLYADVARYLGERQADGATVLSFYHRQVAAVVAGRYLAGEPGRRGHAQLAAYFRGQPHEFRQAGQAPVANLRQLAELGWQLEQAEDREGLDALLREETAEGRNAWFELCERAGQTAAFAEDVQRAWRLADAAFAAGHRAALALQCRCALLVSTLNSLASNLPGTLVAELVRHRLWPVEQGLAHVFRKSDEGDRVATLVELLP
jgi:hypothetical protein